MPVTLPTYVSKPAATPRSVRTIDLDSDGVWTSGRTEADSQIAREADEAARAKRQQGDGHRAVGYLTSARFRAPPRRVLTFPTAWGCGAVGSASRSQ